MSWNGATGVAAWRVLAGKSAQSTQRRRHDAVRIGLRDRDDPAEDYAYVLVAALDSSGQVLGTSPAVAGEELRRLVPDQPTSGMTRIRLSSPAPCARLLWNARARTAVLPEWERWRLVAAAPCHEHGIGWRRAAPRWRSAFGSSTGLLRLRNRLAGSDDQLLRPRRSRRAGQHVGEAEPRATGRGRRGSVRARSQSAGCWPSAAWRSSWSFST
jgi:hypothetical protein